MIYVIDEGALSHLFENVPSCAVRPLGLGCEAVVIVPPPPRYARQNRL
jgi:hypothetical protein